MLNRESNHIDLLEYLHYNTSISENDEEHLDDNQWVISYTYVLKMATIILLIRPEDIIDSTPL